MTQKPELEKKPRWVPRARGLFIGLAILIGLFLAAHAFVVYRDAHRYSSAVTRAAEGDLEKSVYVALYEDWHEDLPPKETFERLLEEYRDDGLRLIGLCNTDAELLEFSGEADPDAAALVVPKIDFESARWRERISEGPPPEFFPPAQSVGERLRLVRPLLEPDKDRPHSRGGKAFRRFIERMHHGMHRDHGGPFGKDDQERRFGRGDRGGPDERDDRRGPFFAREERMIRELTKRLRWLVIEFEPLEAQRIERRAAASLTVSLTAAVLLLIATFVISRSAARADRIRAQLAHDRQLKALGQMSAVLGHELRNPLASLKGHAQLAEEKLDEDHPSRRGIVRVVDEATRLETLTTQVLDFAKSGVVERRAVPPAALAREAAERLDGAIELDGSEAPESFPLDPERMEQVLVNLLDNALAAQPGERPVELRIASEGVALLITVRDRGPGLQPGDESRIFEPFYTRRIRGTGLGLALAQRIVEAHGGTIQARNHPEGGALFEIVIPPA